MNGKSDRDKINEALAVLENNFDITLDLREKLIRILS